MCKCGVLLSISVVIVSSLILLVTSFNVDTVNYVQHKGPDESMFGFSVATHKEHGRSWVLVGAPTAQGQQSRINRGGVVFKCSTTDDNRCDEISFHQDGSDDNRDDKSKQWFGATISSSGVDGPVVACAPRYVWFTTSREERRDPVGTCYIARDDFRKFSEYSPCRTSLFGYHRQGSCQAGFSAGISKDGRRLFVGAPGSWYWQGQTYSIDPLIKFPFTPGMFGEAFGFGTSGQIIQQSLDDRPAVMSTPEGSAKDDDSYMGYSMVVGDFNGVGVQGVAVGMPKAGVSLEGKVLLYTWNLTNYLNITGYQLGAYFGYSVAASDIDGDGRDDLIIGAPLHTEFNNENKYEVGRVHIARQGSGNYAERDFLDGINSKSRFGLSLSTLGDMNLDGYGDFAVGAPYDGVHERGAVYIFQGSANGVIKKFSQVIYAEDVQGSFGGNHPLSTFGFSLAGGLDLDGNDYPDLAIGAYLSDTSYFFRARPVVKVEAVVRFLTKSKQIFLEQKDCIKPNTTNVRVTCTRMEVCMRYTGIGAPPRIEMGLKYNLDARKDKHSRMYLDRSVGKSADASMYLYKEAPLNCEIQNIVYLEDPIVDKLTELEIEVSYFLKDSGYYQQSTQRDPRSILVPVIDLSTPAVVNDSISIYKNCGPDNVCIPDLHLVVDKKVDKYLHQVGKSLEFFVEITNSEDDSYNTKFYVELPKGITYKIATALDKTQSKMSCTNTFNASVYVCDIGNPLVKDSVVRFKLEVEPLPQQQLLNPTYTFRMNVTSANAENQSTLFDNSREISIDIWVHADLATEGRSIPSNVFYDVSQYKSISEAKTDAEVGPHVVHHYIITNKGPSAVQEVEIFIIWPLSTLSGEDLLYLLRPPNTYGGNVKCEAIDSNYKELQLVIDGSMERIPTPIQTTAPNGTGTEGGATKPGLLPDTITKTITTVTFFDINKRKVRQLEIIGELGSEEYWGNITAASMEFEGPLTIESNSSNLLIKYRYGQIIEQTRVSRPPSSAELRYMSYQINSNVTTVVKYYGFAGDVIYEEQINAQPGSAIYNDRIKSTKDRYGQQIASFTTETTRHIICRSSDGKVLHDDILIQRGKDGNLPGIETVVTTVIFYGPDGKVLAEDRIEGEATTDAYWNRVNKISSGYHVPVTIHTTTTRIITYTVNGKEVKEEKPMPAPQALTAHVESSTTLTITTSSGQLLHKGPIPGEKGSAVYNDYINNLIIRFKEPIKIITETIYTITYSSTDGTVRYRGTVRQEVTESYNPSQIETTEESTITTVIVYDISGNAIQQQNLTDEPRSNAYWDKINRIVYRYEQPVTLRASTIKIITHYLNGQVIRTERGDRLRDREDSFTSKTDMTTTIKITNSNSGQLLYEAPLPGGKGSEVYNRHYNEIVGRFREPIRIEITTIYLITYRTSDGTVIYSDSFSDHQEEIRNAEVMETRKTTVTLVIFYDHNKNILDTVEIHDQQGSDEYWKKINEIISRYHEPVTIRTTTKTITTFYVNGQPIRTDEGGTAAAEESFTTKTDITTEITITSSTGQVLYQGPLSGEKGSKLYNDYLNDIINRYNREPITIDIKTTYIVTYRSLDGSAVYTGTHIEHHTEHRNVSSPEEQRTTTITTIIFYDGNRNVIHQEEIRDQPESSAYWNKLNTLITKYKHEHQHVIIDISTRKVITYYVNNKAIRTEKVDGIAGTRELSPEVVATTTVTVYRSDMSILYQGTIPGEKGTTAYNNFIKDIISRYTEPISITTKTTYTITYRGAGAQVVNTGTSFKEETQSYNQHHQGETTQTRTITTIKIYDSHRSLIHEGTITDEPGSAAYWEHIKNAVSRITVPVNIYTNTSQVITYYVNGRESRKEQVGGNAGIYDVPFTPNINITNEIVYYDADRNELFRESVNGELSQEDRDRHVTAFKARYNRYFTMETTTTRTIAYRTSDGRILHNEGNLQIKPKSPQQQSLTRTTTKTTFTVYGADRRTIVHEETIDGEPGSTAYNDAIVKILSRFTHESITIYTNSTKTITLFTEDGRALKHENVPESRSTVQRNGASNARTTITFFGPGGETLHSDTIQGAPGPDIYKQLNEIAREYGGVIKSYGGQLNEDGSIGGAVTVVDSPYPGNRPKPSGHHFSTDFDAQHGQGQGQSHWSSGYNQSQSFQHSGGRQGGRYGGGSSTSFNFQDSNQQDLEGLRTGVIDSGFANTRNVDYSVDSKARSNFETFNSDGSHNYLANHGGNVKTGRPDSRGIYVRRKREDTTDADIQKLSNCTSSNCLAIRCLTGPMQKDAEIKISLQARVIVQTLKTISMTQPVSIKSMLLARISHFQEISGSPAQRTLYKEQAVTSVMAPQPDIKPDIVPLWVVILSAVAGTLILLLLILLLHMCGFFKRNRPSDAPERQPLNRNGHFQHGDEAL